jgi:hypothetical protein
LTQARRLVKAAMFGANLSRLLARTGELLDEIDEILIGLNPGRDHDAFARVARLHRELEEVQSLTPREYRWMHRRSSAFAVAPPRTSGRGSSTIPVR